MDSNLPTEIAEVVAHHDPQSYLLPTSLISVDGKVTQLVMIVDHDYGADKLFSLLRLLPPTAQNVESVIARVKQ